MNNNKQLFAKKEQSIINYDKDEAVRLANMALEKGIEPAVAINEGFVKEIQAVGDLFGREEIFLPEFMGAEAMTAANGVLGEAIKKSGGKAKYLAKGIAGTVEGDIHVIGINLVTTFLVANGFDIELLGTDIPSSLFVEKAKELKPDLILLSALLTTTMPNQKEVIDSLKEGGCEGDSWWCSCISGLGRSNRGVDHETDLVRIPDQLIEECLKRVPQKIVIGGRSR